MTEQKDFVDSIHASEFRESAPKALITSSAVNRGDGSACETLDLKARGPEFGCPAAVLKDQA